MTVGQAIGRADGLKPNAWSLREQQEWLRKLEWMLKREVLDTHEPGILFREPGEDAWLEAELTLSAPFDELYVRWLEAQTDLYNGEPERYNSSIALFNAELSAFESWYNRTYAPLGAGDWR